MPDSSVKLEWNDKKVIAAAQKITQTEEKNCATRLQRRIERYAPVDTGKLRASIRQYKSKLGANMGYTVFAGESPAGASPKSYAMPRRMKYWNRFAFYALWVERGTRDRITHGGRYTGKMKARRFMRKAINEEKRAFFLALEKQFS